MRAHGNAARSAVLSRSFTPLTTPHLGINAPRRLQSWSLGNTAQPGISHDMSRVRVGASRRPARRQPVSKDELVRTASTTRQATAAATPKDAGVSAGVPTPTTVYPTGIAATRIAAPISSVGPTQYGYLFAQTLATSGGNISADITIGEKVTVPRDDFRTGFKGVALGSLTWGPRGNARIHGRDIFDNIATRPVDATHFVPGPPGLPAIIDTPQELHYRISSGPRNKFADVPIKVTLRDAPFWSVHTYEVETSVNRLASVQRYTGPVP